MRELKSNWRLYYVQDASFEGVYDVSQYPFLSNISLPTCLEKELFRNGILGDPYFGTNAWDYEKYEDYHQIYVYRFQKKKGMNYLYFEGVDTIADIYINDVKIGTSSNSFLPFSLKLPSLKDGLNVLKVHIHPNVLEGKKFSLEGIHVAQKYQYEGLHIRKRASSYGWDILTRTVLGGIWKKVYFLEKVDILKNTRITLESFKKDEVKLRFSFETEEKNLVYKVRAKCRDSSFFFETKGPYELLLKKPYLWNIRGYGEANLYEVEVEVYRRGLLLETHRFNYGIREVKLKRSSFVEEGGSFEFYINDQKVFLLGTNWVPTDALKGIDDKRMKKAMKLLLDLRCNALRVWGGGSYESDAFYDFCDKNGIFVWQDFMMACATYPQDEVFQKAIRLEAAYQVKRLRNHPSICLWAGDNESDFAYFYWTGTHFSPNKENFLTRKVLPELLKEEDAERPYLPSSPYLDLEAEKMPGTSLSEDHAWGPRDYFKGDYYRNVACYFASEMGYHALNSPKSLRKFLKEPWPLFTLKDEKRVPTLEYLCHSTSVRPDYESPYAYRIELLDNQVATLFKKKPENLKDYSFASQISQAEALKYFIERMRKDMKRNGGILWWNLLDGWPQVSDAIVDYYFDKKLAYEYVKRSQDDLLLFMDEGENLDLFVSNRLGVGKEVTATVFDAKTKEVLLSENISVHPYSSKKIHSFSRDDEKKLFILRLADESGKVYWNHYYSNILSIDFDDYVSLMRKWHLLKKKMR